MPQTPRSPLVLVAPLSWGLGHATRCIPLIHTLQRLGCEVMTASDGATRSLLVEEFPLLTHLSSPHTTIRYSRYKWLFGGAMLLLLPRFWLQVKREKQWIRTVADRYRFDAIISDNRYGLAHPNIPSVIITHQLAIRTGWGQLADRWLQRILYRYIDRYQQVWVPDISQEPSLAGALSHPVQLPSIPVQYLGILNRLSMPITDATPYNSTLLVLLSGPEPQRSLLEKMILNQAVSYNGKLIVVRGLPTSLHGGATVTKAESTRPDPYESLALLYGISHVTIFDHLSAAQLQALLPSIGYIICRSGYTTLMEMIPLRKKLLLIPTPGQPEQTYLAAYAQQQQYAPQFLQAGFSIQQALDIGHTYPYRFPDQFNESPLSTIVSNWVRPLQNSQEVYP
ncbi:MAG: glycosyltransferase [Sphingomonadales bacterium]